ncbi:MAG: ATP-binding protein [Desulfobacterales bacterium]|jgi:anti-sigma regulatory factor (Ser/Thr protein kinase)
MRAISPGWTEHDNLPLKDVRPARVTGRPEIFRPMPRLKKSFHIKARDFIRAGEASINVQNLLKSMDFDSRLIRRVAICGYESEMNVVMHGGDGTLSIELDDEKLVLEIIDDGPGIEDIELAMQAGYSTANDDHREMGFGAGMGLPNMKKNSDRIQIESPGNQGTVVRMVFFIPEKGKTN